MSASPPREIVALLSGLSREERQDLIRVTCGDDHELLTALEGILAGEPAPPALLETLGEISWEQLGAAAERRRSPPDPPSLAGRRLGHLRLEERIGRGGMGEVYRARDLALDRLVAVKVLPRGFSPALRARLRREGWAGARLQHPNLATFFEAGEADGVDFIAMEYVPGRTLRRLLREGPLAVDEALAIAACLLEALAHAHQAGILHRDIKPENVMVTGPGEAKLLDLGLAKAWSAEGEAPDQEELATLAGPPAGWLGEGDATAATLASAAAASGSLVLLTRRGAVLGTPGYMAPEQVRGDRVDARTDLFALAAVLYEMLSGRRAIAGATHQDRLAATGTGAPQRLERSDLAPGLAEVAVRSLHRDPARRHPSAAAFLADLRRVAPPQAARAGPETLAILGFDDLAADPEDEWIGSGLVAELGGALGRVPGLRVLAPREVWAAQAAAGSASPMEAALRSQCSSILCGSFRREGEALQVRARLVEAASGFAIGEETFEGSVDRLFDLRDRLAEAVAAMLHRPAPAAGAPAAPRVEAYRCCVRGLQLWWGGLRKGSIEEARQELERAVELAPDYVPALAGLAELQAFRANVADDPQLAEQAIHHARRAISLDPETVESHVWLGYALHLQGRHLEAHEALEEARRRGPDHPHAYYFAGLALQGVWRRDELLRLRPPADGEQGPATEDLHRWRRGEALGFFQRTVELTPHNAFAWLLAGWQHLELGRAREATWCLEEAVRREGASSPPLAGAAVYLGDCLRRCGDLAGARQRCVAGLEAVERSDHLYRDSFRGIGLCALGRTALEQGDRQAARSAFRQAALHLRGRPRARGGGQLLVQALAGTSRAEDGPEPLDEGLRLFRDRQGLSFGWLLGCTDDITLLELSRAARALGREGEAEGLRAEAVERGSTEAGR